MNGLRKSQTPLFILIGGLLLTVGVLIGLSLSGSWNSHAADQSPFVVESSLSASESSNFITVFPNRDPGISETRVIFAPDLPPEIAIDQKFLLEVASILKARANGLGFPNDTSFKVTGAREITGIFPSTDTESVKKSLPELTKIGLLEIVDLGTNELEPGTMIRTDHNPEIPYTTPTGKSWHTLITNAEINNMGVMPDQDDQYALYFELNEEGTKILADFTKTHIGNFLAITVDKVIVAVPMINAAITKGKAQIRGEFSLESATALAVLIRTQPLPFPIRVVDIKASGK